MPHTPGDGRVEVPGLFPKERAISSLKSNPKDLSVLDAYRTQRERQLIERGLSTLQLDIEIAEIYRDAGLIDAARKAFFDAADRALEEDKDGLYDTLHYEIDKLPSVG